MKLLVAKQGMLSAYTNLSKPNWRLIFVYYTCPKQLTYFNVRLTYGTARIYPTSYATTGYQGISQLSQTSSIN